MNKFFVNLFIIFILSLGIFSASLIYAQNEEAPDVVFPVAELGGCKDKTECFAYCELPENGSQCLAFAKKHQLLSEEEIRVAEKVEGVKGGPGGCNSRKSCEKYCDDVAHMDECLSFAEENNLMQGKELEEAKKVRAVLQNGGKLPGDCRNKTACQAYCENSEHMEECLEFAEKAGFIPPEELEQARKLMPLMKSGETPGGCKSKNECETYCDGDDHFEECINFAEKHGIIPEGDRKNIEAFKKAGGRGPGGCRGRQCETFCQDSANQEICFAWAKENGLVSEEDMRRMEGRPPEEREGMSEGREGFRREGQEGREGREMNGPGARLPDGQGCQSPEECMAYCKNNPEECKKFAPPEGGMRRQEGRPDGRPEGRPEGGEFPPGEFRGEPPESRDFSRPEGSEFQSPAEEQYRQDFQEEYNRQYEQQYEQQYKQEYEGQYEEQRQQPMQEETQIHSLLPKTNLLGLVLASFLELFK